MRRWNGRMTAVVLFAAAVIFLAAVTAAGFGFSEEALVTDFSRKNLEPGGAYLFGTDWLGRDMFVRTLTGLSMSIRIGLLSAGVSSVLAMLLGTMAAVMGKTVDSVITWVIGFKGVVIGVALTHWTSLARLIRGEVLQLKEALYIRMAQKLGMSRWKIVWKHMLPHLFPQFLVGLILTFPHAILHEASITFLGFGLPPEQPAIGIILSESMQYLAMGRWWLALFPGLLLVLTVILFDVAGESLQKLLDPGSAHK